jgi:GNAT superfamily N-acetyltransferase
MSQSIRLATEDDLPVMHAVLTICGEDMHRNQGMSHWHPYGSFERYKAQIVAGSVYGVYEDEFLIGTFYLSETMPHYYASIDWGDPEAKALYGSKFGILPVVQKRGMGQWTMSAVDKLVEELGYKALRFDAVSRNESLIRFYDKLGYQRRAKLEDDTGTVVAICYERRFGT